MNSNKLTENLKKISKDGKFLLLAYDQGLEIGPGEFNDQNVDPKYILKIAENGYFTGVIFQKGIAEKYYRPGKSKVPLILKLNGKDKLYQGEPVSYQLTSVKEAVELGAVAVGYTIYLGSEYEPEMLREFGKIEEEAHQAGLALVGWMYPRGKSVPDPNDPDVTAYAARVGLELGADLVKVHYTGSVETFRWVVKSAGEAGVLASGGPQTSEAETLKQAREVMAAGAAGLAIGRNVWKAKDPNKISQEIHRIVFGEANVRSH